MLWHSSSFKSTRSDVSDVPTRLTVGSCKPVDPVHSCSTRIPGGNTVSPSLSTRGFSGAELLECTLEVAKHRPARYRRRSAFVAANPLLTELVTPTVGRSPIRNPKLRVSFILYFKTVLPLIFPTKRILKGGHSRSITGLLFAILSILSRVVTHVSGDNWLNCFKV